MIENIFFSKFLYRDNICKKKKDKINSTCDKLFNILWIIFFDNIKGETIYIKDKILIYSSFYIFIYVYYIFIHNKKYNESFMDFLVKIYWIAWII